MGILDFDDKQIMKSFRKRDPKIMHTVDADDEKRLGELNNYGRKKVSEDFSDSKFSDRVETCCDHCGDIGARGKRRCGNPACQCHVRV